MDIPRGKPGPNFEETAKNRYYLSVVSCEDDKEYFDNFGMSNAKKNVKDIYIHRIICTKKVKLISSEGRG